MISVIIPSWNGKHLLETCLPSLQKQTYRDFEVIVVENGSQDGTAQWLRDYYSWVRVLELNENQGFSGGVNRGIEIAKGSLIAVLNNDTDVDRCWLEALHDASLRNPDAGFFASKVLLMDNPNYVDTTGDAFTIAGFGFKQNWLRAAAEVATSEEYVFGASGCASMYRQVMLKRVGFFDESFFAFGEDLDLSFRAQLLGYKCLFVPQAIVLHQVRATAAPAKTITWYHRNLIWLMYKNLSGGLLALYFPHIITNWILVSIRCVIRGSFTAFVSGLYEGFSQLRCFKEERRWIQKNKVITNSMVSKLMIKNWIGVHWQLMIANRRFKKMNPQ